MMQSEEVTVTAVTPSGLPGLGFSRTKKINLAFFNPIVPGIENIKIRQFIIRCFQTVCFVKRQACLDAHNGERQGLMG